MESENITNEFLAFRESQWTSNGSNIYLQTGSVGIGTLAPRATLDVYGSINALSANFGTIYTAGTSLASLNVSGISNLLGNVIVGNLIVTGNLVNVVSNTQFSNSVSINNAGTSTALKVHQLESTPVHTNNVAEFWDYQTLAMVINGDGNVGIHTTLVNPYSFAVVGASNLDYIKTINLYSSNAVVTSNLFGNVVGSNTVSASTIYGILAGANTITGSSVSATTLYGQLAGSNTVAGSTLYGQLAGSNTISGSSLTLGTALSIANGGTGQTTKSAAFDSLSPMSVAGDLIYGGTSGTGTRLATGTVSQVLHGGTTPSWSAVSLTTDISGTLPVGNGGTNLTTYAVGDLLYASGTTALSKLADVATGSALISGGVGVAPSWNKIGLTTHVTGTLPVGNGGTNLTTYTVGDLLYASGTTALSQLAGVATGSALISGGVGVAPSWNKIGLTTHVTGTLPVGNGGTNLTTYTSGGIIYASGTATLASSGSYTSGQILYGGGAGAAPGSSSTLLWDSTNSRIGIGTVSTPTYAIDVFDQNNSMMRLSEYNGTDGPVIRSYRANGTFAAPTGVVADSCLFASRGFGYTSASAFSGRCVGIELCAAETFTGTATGTYIRFDTCATGTLTNSEKMRITGSGYVGIGVNPTSPLHIVSTQTSTGNMIILDGSGQTTVDTGIRINSGTGKNSYIDFVQNGTLKGNIYWDNANTRMVHNGQTTDNYFAGKVTVATTITHGGWLFTALNQASCPAGNSDLNWITQYNSRITMYADGIRFNIPDPGMYVATVQLNADTSATCNETIALYYWNSTAGTSTPGGASWVNMQNSEWNTAWTTSVEARGQFFIYLTASTDYKFQIWNGYTTTFAWSQSVLWSRMMIYKVG